MILDPHHQNPFKVPEGYFEMLPEQIMQHIEQHTQPTVQPQRKQRFGAWSIVRYAVATAATVALFFAFSHLYNLHQDTAPAVAQSEYEIGSDYMLASLDANDMFEYLTSDDFQQNETFENN